MVFRMGFVFKPLLLRCRRLPRRTRILRQGSGVLAAVGIALCDRGTLAATGLRLRRVRALQRGGCIFRHPSRAASAFLSAALQPSCVPLSFALSLQAWGDASPDSVPGRDGAAEGRKHGTTTSPIPTIGRNGAAEGGDSVL